MDSIYSKRSHAVPTRVCTRQGMLTTSRQLPRAKERQNRVVKDTVISDPAGESLECE